MSSWYPRRGRRRAAKMGRLGGAQILVGVAAVFFVLLLGLKMLTAFAVLLPTAIISLMLRTHYVHKKMDERIAALLQDAADERDQRRVRCIEQVRELHTQWAAKLSDYQLLSIDRNDLVVSDPELHSFVIAECEKRSLDRNQELNYKVSGYAEVHRTKVAIVPSHIRRTRKGVQFVREHVRRIR